MVRSPYPWRVEIFKPSYQVDTVEAELHEAIIRAVLTAKRSK